jgi:Flp pilus assembly protein TadD
MTSQELPQIMAQAMAYFRAGRMAEAEMLYRQVLAGQPNHLEALNMAGVVALQTGRYEAALELFESAIRLSPRFAPALSNLGNALRNMGRPTDAMSAYRRALTINPYLPETLSNMGAALADIGHFKEAIDFYQRALNVKADLPQTRWNCGIAMLTLGDFERGWPLFEWRRRCPEAGVLLNPPLPMWNGENLQGKRILIHSEQGFGDAIQFVRYVPLIAQRGGRVVVGCDPLMYRLFAGVEGIERFAVIGEPMTNFDVHCPILSLATVSKTTLATIPAQIPYLTADGDLIAKWKSRLPADGIRVGLVWAGAPNHRRDRWRSIELKQLAELAKTSRVHWVSLQKGPAAGQAKNPPDGMTLLDWTDELEDFAQTAGLLANLDLLIAVDTAAAHLAGAMGKPAWLLLPFVPDWRWLLQRQDSPWYPTTRLFRQPAIDDWQTPIRHVAEALQALAKTGAPMETEKHG